MLFAQYSNADNLNNLLYGTSTYPGLNSYLNINYVDFVTNFFDVRTAGTEGLDNWGAILGITRNIYIPNVSTLFGFGDSASPPSPPGPTGYPQAFNYGGFYSGGAKYTALDNDIFRCMILLRYQTLTCNMSIQAISQILNQFFKNLNTYGYANTQVVQVQDNLAPMSITYTFSQTLEPYQTVIFSSVYNPTNFLPRPMGVKAIIVQP